ncbi:MAG: proline--tRNA ligase, partial [Candidatus Omnitrophica bacterium]|nr:proline--tRNA ligase [Candidatus Omnitrophota bacterium]
MRYSQAFIPTLKENPADAEAISHKLMSRAGLIRKLISGAYSYLPLGFRVLKKVEEIVRQEMNSAGAQEILMPALQPAELWHETGRYAVLGEELVTFKDRHGKEMVIGPTHEEVATDIARGQLRSYKDLPKIIYQIQTKLRDEPRPRFGIIRSKEFIMKDAYSFDRDEKGLDESYRKMFDAYKQIFKRCGLDAIVVEADVGFMGGSESAEFLVLSESGEDIVVGCESCGYKGALTKTACFPQEALKPKTQNLKPKAEIDTPGATTIEKVSKLLKCEPSQTIKTLLYTADGESIAVLIRGDHDVNEAKLSALLKAKELKLADEAAIQKATGGPMGFSGPCGIKGTRLVIDHAVSEIADGITGANKKDTHLVHVLPGRDFPIDETFDIRYIGHGEPCPKCKEAVSLARAIEVGHVFKLGTKYSDSMGAKFLDSNGKESPFIMGCYGIGINRIIASSIEQHHDKDGIIWPLAIAPYQVTILALNMDDAKVIKSSEELYEQLLRDGIEVLLDDRDISPGIKFKDADLIGIPIQVVIGSKGIKKSVAEITKRSDKKKQEVPAGKVA